MDDMSEIKQLLLLPKHKNNFYGDSTSTADPTDPTNPNQDTTSNPEVAALSPFTPPVNSADPNRVSNSAITDNGFSGAV